MKLQKVIFDSQTTQISLREADPYSQLALLEIEKRNNEFKSVTQVLMTLESLKDFSQRLIECISFLEEQTDSSVDICLYTSPDFEEK
jgi:hypothetical protein